MCARSSPQLDSYGASEARVIELLTTCGWILFVLAVAGVFYTVLAVVFVRHFLPAPLTLSRTLPSEADSVAILKPLHGAEPGLRHNLEGFFIQAKDARTAIVCGVQDPADPARGLAESVIGAHPLVKAQLVIDTRRWGQNHKISNVINIMSAVEADILVLSDSDIGVQADYLRVVAETLRQPNVGVVTCPYYGKAEGGFWSDVAAMGLSYQFLPNVITGVGLRMAHPCMGSTIALRRETLQRIGGFEAFSDVLADDYAIGAAVRSLGLRSVVAPSLVAHSCTEATGREVLSHELRWARTVRGLDLAGHVGSLITHPTPLALGAVVFLEASPASLSLLLVALTSRFWLMWQVDRATARPIGAWWLMPMRDMISVLVFAASFFARSVEWRGAKFHVTKDGGLRPV